MPVAHFTTIPIVDWRDLSRNRTKFDADLRYALCDVGFAVLIEAPDLDAEFQAACFQEAHTFFSLSQGIKQRYSMDKSPHFRGYAAQIDGELSDPDGVAIATEAFQLGPERPAPDRSTVDVCEMLLRGPNQWPAEVPGLKGHIHELHRRSWKLSVNLGHLICQMLGTTAEKYDRYFHPTDPDYIAAMNYNQAATACSPTRKARVVEELRRVDGADAHVDGAPFITVLFCDQPGLEVLASDGKSWVDVPAIPGGAVINIGSSLSKLSGGQCTATVHRVNPLKIPAPRVSLPFFLLPSLNGELVPFDELQAKPRLAWWPKRSRRLAYALSRLELFRKATQRWYPKEYQEVQQAVADEELRLSEARARRNKEESRLPSRL